MYPMAMPPHYGGSHQPMHHPSIYTAPLISPESYLTAQTISHADRQILEQGRQYQHPNMASFYVNPTSKVPDGGFSLYRAAISSTGNPNSTHALNLLDNTRNPEHAFNPHCASLRQKPCFASHKLSSQNEEMLQEMNKLHLGYIETEDSPQKMEQRQRLEELTNNFLSITPHQSKFAFPEVLEILENTVSMSSRFDAHKTACAFDALAQYALNLVCQPWRREFRQLKLYNGFWVHQISNHLIGAESILQLMGYQPVYSKVRTKNQFCGSSEDFLYSHTSVLDLDLISRLALDCIIAYCECQCLHKIKERLESFDFGFSQILEFRKRYLGDVDCTVRHLTYSLKQNLHLAKQPDTQRTKPLSSSPPPPLPSRYSSHSSSSTALKSPSAATSGRYFETPCAGNPDALRVPLGSPVPESGGSKSHKGHAPRSGGSTHDNCFRTEYWDRVTGVPVDYITAVPTARLIDLDSSIDGSSRGRRLLPKIVNRKSRTVPPDTDDVDGRSVTAPCQQLSPELLKAATLDEHMEASLHLVNKAAPSRGSGHQGKSSLDHWDFVYRNLEKQGYSKDIGDRGDILNELKQNSGPRQADASPAFPNKTYNNCRKDKSKPLPISQALQQFTLNETAIDQMDGRTACGGGKSHATKSTSGGLDKHSDSKRNSAYDNLVAKFEPDSCEYKTTPLPKKINNNTRADSRAGEPPKGQQSEPREHLSSERKRPRQEDSSASAVPWSCPSCTYLNIRQRVNCEMCHKSRCVRRDDSRLESGSKQCLKCTLINQKGMNYCSACDNPLDSSRSTYI